MNEDALHKQLPIGENEKILTVINHHWYAFASIYIGAGFISLLITAVLIGMSLTRNELGISGSTMGIVFFVGVLFIALVVGFSLVPVWIKKQERLVLTEEAILQIRKPSLFASKISQLNLQHIADVTVDQTTLGRMLGFAHLTIETPGEQDNFEFSVVADAKEAAKQIINAHENYAAAMESGQIETTLGQRPPVPGSAWRSAPQTPPAQPQGWQNPLAPEQAADPIEQGKTYQTPPVAASGSTAQQAVDGPTKDQPQDS